MLAKLAKLPLYDKSLDPSILKCVLNFPFKTRFSCWHDCRGKFDEGDLIPSIFYDLEIVFHLSKQTLNSITYWCKPEIVMMTYTYYANLAQNINIFLDLFACFLNLMV